MEGGGMAIATIEECRGAKALDTIRIEQFGAYFWPVQWIDGSLHAAAVYFDAGGKFDVSHELAEQDFDNVAELIKAVSKELEAALN
jgi:hypothetical protein